MLKGFRDFLFRGNVVDLAVAVVLGGVFGAVVGSLVKDILGGVIGALVGKPDFSGLVWEIHGGRIAYGNFLNALISFVTIATVVYFLIVLPINSIAERAKALKAPPTPSEPTTKICPECLSEIPLAARRCAHCAQPVA